jgi:hypothetical protein
MNMSEEAAVSRRAAGEVGAAGGLAVLLRPGSSGPAQAQGEGGTAPVPGITVVGDGVVSVKPDTCALHLGVHSTARTASDALAGTRRVAERIVQQLRAQGVGEGDLQTSGLNVYPIEGRTPDGGIDPAATTGYRASATISIDAADVARAGALLDAGMQAGATSVQGLTYGLRQEAPARQRALQAAIEDARGKAQALAMAARLPLGAIRSVVEQQTFPLAGAKGIGGLGGGGEGIAPGEHTVASRVAVTFGVG